MPGEKIIESLRLGMLDTSRAWDQRAVWTKMMNCGDATGTDHLSKVEINDS